MEYFKTITFFSFSLPLLTYLLSRKHDKYGLARVIFILITYSCLNEAVVAYFRYNGTFSKFPKLAVLLYSFFTIAEFSFLAYYLLKSFHNKKLKRFLKISACIFFLVALGNIYVAVFRDQTAEIDVIPIASSAIILIVFSILLLYEEIQNPRIQFVYFKPSFWIVVGIMIYFSGTFFLFLQLSALSDIDRKNYWAINLICIILKNIFFAISFLVPGNEENTNELEPDYPFQDMEELK